MFGYVLVNGLKVLVICCIVFEAICALIDNCKTIVTNCFHVFLFSVKGQSLDARPDTVIGVYGGSVNITWTLTKKAKSDKISNVRIFLGNPSEGNILYEGTSTFIKHDYARTNFGDRIKDSLEESKYRVTLNNLSLIDLSTFTLVVSTEDLNFNRRPNMLKSVKIDKVKGMLLF